MNTQRKKGLLAIGGLLMVIIVIALAVGACEEANSPTPTNPAAPTTPTDPADPADPADPTDPTDPADPAGFAFICPVGTPDTGTATTRGEVRCTACFEGFALVDAVCIGSSVPTRIGVTLPPGYHAGANATVDVVADFEDPAAMIAAGWTATDTLASPTTADAWIGRSLPDSGAAYVGARSLNTCKPDATGFTNCDNSNGTLTSPDIPITRRYLNFLVAGTFTTDDIAVIIQDSEQDAGDLTANIALIRPLYSAPAFFISDFDWRTIDLQAEMMEADSKIRIVIKDEAAGYINVDHFFFSDAPWGLRQDEWSLDRPTFIGGGGSNTQTAYLRLHTGGFDPASGQPTALFGGFDDATTLSATAGWAFSINNDSTTDTFELDSTTNAPSAASSLAGVFTTNADHGRIGAYPISTNNIGGAGGRFARATISSPAFPVTGRYINFLLRGGSGAGGPIPSVTTDGTATAAAHLEFRLFPGDADVTIADQARLRMTPRACGEDLNVNAVTSTPELLWHSIDVSAYAGEMLRFQLADTSPEGCQTITLDHLYFSDTPISQSNIRATLTKPQ